MRASGRCSRVATGPPPGPADGYGRIRERVGDACWQPRPGPRNGLANLHKTPGAPSPRGHIAATTQLTISSTTPRCSPDSYSRPQPSRAGSSPPTSTTALSHDAVEGYRDRDRPAGPVATLILPAASRGRGGRRPLDTAVFRAPLLLSTACAVEATPSAPAAAPGPRSLRGGRALRGSADGRRPAWPPRPAQSARGSARPSRRGSSGGADSSGWSGRPTCRSGRRVRSRAQATLSCSETPGRRSRSRIPGLKINRSCRTVLGVTSWRAVPAERARTS